MVDLDCDWYITDSCGTICRGFNTNTLLSREDDKADWKELARRRSVCRYKTGEKGIVTRDLSPSFDLPLVMVVSKPGYLVVCLKPLECVIVINPAFMNIVINGVRTRFYWISDVVVQDLIYNPNGEYYTVVFRSFDMTFLVQVTCSGNVYFRQTVYHYWRDIDSCFGTQLPFWRVQDVLLTWRV